MIVMQADGWPQHACHVMCMAVASPQCQVEHATSTLAGLADVNLEARKRAQARVQRELDEQKAKGG
jgi:hypothetical protein